MESLSEIQMSKTFAKRKSNELSDESDSTEIYSYLDQLTTSEEVMIRETIEVIIKSIELTFDNLSVDQISDQKNDSNNSILTESGLKIDSQLFIDDLDLSEDFWNDFDLDLIELDANRKTDISQRHTSSLENNCLVINGSADQSKTNEQSSTSQKSFINTEETDFKHKFQMLLNRMESNVSKKWTTCQTDSSLDARRLLSQLDSINDSIIALENKFNKRIKRLQK